MSVTDVEAREYVTDVRRATVESIEERLYELEARIAQHASGPIRIPAPGSPLRDLWREITESCGRWIVHFQVDGRRLFSRSGSDGLDAYLERYDPGSVNNNAAVDVFAADMNAVVELRRQRGAIMRDGLPSALTVARDEYEYAALYGALDAAVAAVVELDQDNEWCEDYC